MTSTDVANYFIAITSEDAGDAMSNLKVQKLVYYAQGFHLALYGKPLFDEEIEAWLHGPVVPSLYHTYKDYKANPLPPPEGLDIDTIPSNVRELLDDVYNVYGQYSAWKLRQMTHDEPPWRDHYKEGESCVIPMPAMTEFFKSRLA